MHSFHKLLWFQKELLENVAAVGRTCHNFFPQTVHKGKLQLSKAIEVLTVTILPDRDLQKCAALHFWLAALGWGGGMRHTFLHTTALAGVGKQVA
jgi:hypothetical protein